MHCCCFGLGKDTAPIGRGPPNTHKIPALLTKGIALWNQPTQSVWRTIACGQRTKTKRAYRGKGREEEREREGKERKAGRFEIVHSPAAETSDNIVKRHAKSWKRRCRIFQRKWLNFKTLAKRLFFLFFKYEANQKDQLSDGPPQLQSDFIDLKSAESAIYTMKDIAHRHSDTKKKKKRQNVKFAFVRSKRTFLKTKFTFCQL